MRDLKKNIEQCKNDKTIEVPEVYHGRSQEPSIRRHSGCIYANLQILCYAEIFQLPKNHFNIVK